MNGEDIKKIIAAIATLEEKTTNLENYMHKDLKNLIENNNEKCNESVAAAIETSVSSWKWGIGIMLTVYVATIALFVSGVI